MRINYYYTQEEINYLKNIIPNRILPEINILYKQKFNKEITNNQLCAFKRRYKIKSGKISNSKKGQYIYNFNQEEIKWLKEKIIDNNTSTKIMQLYKEKFNKKLSYNAFYRFKVRYNLKSGVENGGCFQKGNPLNPNKPKPIGCERVYYDNNKKRVQIKVDNKKWVDKSRYVYEQHYGKIPKNCVIIFIDGNRDNFNIDNLKCITKEQHRIMAGNCLYFNDKELNETSISIAKLISKVKEVENEK